MSKKSQNFNFKTVLSPEEIIGHHKNRDLFKKAYQRKALHHAWLLKGSKGVGKSLVAKEFASILCKEHASSLILENNPHFYILEKESITVEDIRDLLSFLQLTPALSGWRVIIIDSVDDLNPNAMNAFLKILEEPPSQTIFFLISHSPYALLPTIKSRVIGLSFQKLSYEESQQVINRLCPKLPKNEYDLFFEFLGGSPGLIIEAYEKKVFYLIEDIKNFFLERQFNHIKIKEIIENIVRKEDSFSLVKESIFFFLYQFVKSKCIQKNIISNIFFEELSSCMEFLQKMKVAEQIYLDRTSVILNEMLGLKKFYC